MAGAGSINKSWKYVFPWISGFCHKKPSALSKNQKLPDKDNVQTEIQVKKTRTLDKEDFNDVKYKKIDITGHKPPIKKKW